MVVPAERRRAGHPGQQGFGSTAWRRRPIPWSTSSAAKVRRYPKNCGFSPFFLAPSEPNLLEAINGEPARLRNNKLGTRRERRVRSRPWRRVGDSPLGLRSLYPHDRSRAGFTGEDVRRVTVAPALAEAPGQRKDFLRGTSDLVQTRQPSASASSAC